jgi:predicted ATPase
MLVSWTLENFKSVGEEVTLPLSPITLLVGANSSGKSSIIQSILLIKQTLQYATADRPIALNGPLLKLGNYNDVKNVLSESDGFKIGWNYDAQAIQELFPGLMDSLRIEAQRSPYVRDLTAIKCTTIFDIDREALQSELALLQPHLYSSSLSVASGFSQDIRIAKVDVHRSGVPIEDDLIKRQRLLSPLLGAPGELLYSIDSLDPETKAAVFEDHPNGQIVAAVVRHFFPVFAAVKFDVAVRRATQIADAIITLRKTVAFQRDYAGLTAPPGLLELLEEWRQANAEFFPIQESLFQSSQADQIVTVGDVIDRLISLRRYSSIKTASFPSLQDLHPRIAHLLSGTFPSEIQIELERLRLISEASFFSREYFENYVRYLGPLRDEPKPLYPLEALGNPTDVGFKGENTAAVLHLNQYRQISYLTSNNFAGKAGDQIGTAVGRATLQAAVVDWLSYMGVVEGVSTGDRGKIGHELQVKTPGLQKFHDLTNVGVGVSQVLPIVVMALLAPTGSLLIFEQPELHLHPRVQTRLADFFISIALAGKQCLVETHSEYLIHRLRRRIAEAPDDQLTKLSKLFFVERTDGLTSCREVDISRYGAIIDWPADFFDQAQEEAESILQAATVKRAAERKKKKDSDAAGPRN